MLRNFDLPEAVVFYGTDSAVDAGGGAGRPGVTRILDECADVGTAAILLTETLRIEELEGLVMATEGLAPYVSDGTLRLRSSLDVDSAAFPPEALEEDPRLPFGRGGTGHAPSPAALLDAFLSVVVSPRGFGGSSGFGTKDEGPPSRPPLPKHVVALVSGPGRLSRARCSACRMAGVRFFLCRKVHKNCRTCHCLRDIAAPRSRLEGASLFLMDHARRTKAERQVAVKEWMRQGELIRAERKSGQKRRPFYPVAGVWREEGESEPWQEEREAKAPGTEAIVPHGGEDDEDVKVNDAKGGKKKKTMKKKRVRPPKKGDINGSAGNKRQKMAYYVCQHGLMRLCNVGLHQWKSLLADKSNPVPLVHGLVGKVPNSANTERAVRVRSAMKEFLSSTEKEMGDGKFMKQSMRALYELFCYRRGYVLRRGKDGGYGRIEDYEVRGSKELDLDWPAGTPPLPVLSKDVFDSVYNEVFPNAKERRKREIAKAEEERKKVSKATERLLRLERKEREREKLRHGNIRSELERQLERERADHARERDVLMGEIAQLKERLAEMEQFVYAYPSAANGGNVFHQRT